MELFGIDFIFFFFARRVSKFFVQFHCLGTINVSLAVYKVKFVDIACPEKGEMVPFALVVDSIKLGKSRI